MAKWSKGKAGFSPIIITIETKDELDELVESLGDNSGRLLEKVYNELNEYLDSLE